MFHSLRRLPVGAGIGAGTVTSIVTSIAIGIAAPACKGDRDARANVSALEVYSELPAFSLVDHHGKPMTRDGLLGKVTVTDFIFTRCQTICPVATLHMKAIQQQTRELGNKLSLLSISVDPTYDTVERLAAYAAKVKADPARWRFATGPTETVHDLAEAGFKVPMEVVSVNDAGTPDVMHSAHFVLLDKRARVRGYYNSADPKRLKELVRDAKKLVNGE